MPIRTDRGQAAALRQLWAWPLQSWRHFIATTALTAALVTGVTAGASALLGGDPDAPAPAAGTTGSSTPTTTPAQSWFETAVPSSASEPDSDAPTSPSSSRTKEAPSSSKPDTPATPAAGKTADGVKGALATASGFMSSWVVDPDSDVTASQWADGLRAYVTPETLIDLESVDPARIPATTVTGKPKPTTSGDEVVEVDVATDAGTVHLVLVAYPDGRWLVRTWNAAE